MGPGGMEKSIGARAPTLASVGTLLDSSFFLSSKTGASVKIMAILSFKRGIRTLSSGMTPPNCYPRCLNSSSSICSVLILKIFLVRVFLLMTR